MAMLSKKLRSTVTNLGGGVAFWCPGCKEMHAINTEGNGRPRWTWDGNVDAPTFAPSILVTCDWPEGQERCHSFVRGGRIEFLGDCTHDLRGQTVDLPDLPGEAAA